MHNGVPPQQQAGRTLPLNVTLTVVPGAKQSAKLTIFVAPAGVTSIDQFAAAFWICSIVTCIDLSFRTIETKSFRIALYHAIHAVALMLSCIKFRRAE